MCWVHRTRQCRHQWSPTSDTYEVAFLADNPGIWMDHCYNLPHAEQGMVAHRAYSGVETPFVVGGDGRNAPE